MMRDIESNNKKFEEYSVTETEEKSSEWRIEKILLSASLICFLISFILSVPKYNTSFEVEMISSSFVSNEYESNNDNNTTDNVFTWPKPIHPHHNGKVVYLTEKTDSGLVYRREFTAPCGDGMLVFNVGPAAKYEPFTYDIYEDAYAYSDNQGLCFFYPSYKGVQKSTTRLWEPTDPTEQKVPLGDLPTRISTRVVIPVNTKNITTRGGDFLIIRKGNFYNPTYYKHLKAMVNSWPPKMDIDTMKEALDMELIE